MAQLLGVVAVVTLIVTLVSTIVTIWLERAASAAQFLQLTELLLSWEVIAGAVVVGGASTFHAELKALLDRLEK